MEHFDINHSKILYDPPPRVMEIKTKINKWAKETQMFRTDFRTLWEKERVG